MNDIPSYPWSEGDTVFASALNAAIANSAAYGPFLPLSGGGVTGRTSFTVNTTDLPSNSGASALNSHLNTSGPTAGFSISAQTNLTVNAGTTSANKFNNPAISFWSSAIKYIPAGGLPAGTTQLQDQWAYIGNNIDATNGPSSVGGVLISEYDTTANNRDDGAQRSGAVYVFGTSWGVGSPPAARPGYGPPPTTGGWPAAFNSGLSFAIELNCVVNVGIAMGLQYSTALWDCRGAVLHGGTIQTTVAAGGTTLHVNNVVGYMQWGGSTAPVSSSNPMPVTIGANTYHVTAAAFDAAVGGVTTTLGTLTLSSGIIGTDGAAGTAVVQQARTMWLGNGQQLCLAGSGAAYLMADTSDGIQVYTPQGVNINSSFGVSSNATIGNALTVLGSATFSSIIFSALPINAANDAAAAAAGVPVRGVYRNGSVVMVRVA